ncbi:aflatoxin B1 aldehyde reductase member 2 [Colletotrichum orchidophilum]|uniref:Aflatoxin B1 aldehyde reductase member 2 n=1 Tax=Colletotrichum orchidophilum TaxID=1209926 RepID=A0A1G4BA79_9PEZI|nr:aflatoxin B1 aldehyde reductase member 2 [Colletotrichum orchidophilum]OHE98293.1 aflatoxin B1 aldehyde reductase member 2 [Colletotrichum orchidophilum]
MSSATKSSVNLVLGVANVGDTSADPMARYNTPDEVNAFLDVFNRRGYSQLDTSRMYSPQAPTTSEPRLGAVSAGERFAIDTKVTSGTPGCHTKEKILNEIDESLKALKIKQINVEYLHVPDRTTPFEEACEAMNEAVVQGKIRKWGISNYNAAEVQRFVDICEERGLVKPSVYQGHYNPLVRGGEKDLFPVLRKNGIAFYGFSPAAAGFFAGNHKKVRAGGRYDTSIPVGRIYSKFYVKESIMTATEKALEVASKHGIDGHAAALRWTAYHSILRKEHEDSIIIGASSPEQLEASIDMIEQGPLPEDVVSAVEALYEQIVDKIPYHM